MSEDERPRRPIPLADLTELIDAAGGHAQMSRAEIASATAAAVVSAARRDIDAPAADTAPDGSDRFHLDDRFVGLADVVGIETLAELWRDAEPVSLPGALWALYLVRQWCRTRPDDVVRLWRAGEGAAPADAAVAGVADYADIEAIRRLGDAVLAGAYRGDLAVALERAASFFRVVAAGRREIDRGDGAEVTLAARNERAAGDLAKAAAGWRAGTLV